MGSFFVHTIVLICLSSLDISYTFIQTDEVSYLNTYSNLTAGSYQVQLPIKIKQQCVSSSHTTATAAPYYFPPIYVQGTVSASEVQTLCGTKSLCVISADATLVMNGNLVVAALSILGYVVWTDQTQTSAQQWLCAGYVVAEGRGSFNMSVTDPSHTAYIYIMDNGATHSSYLYVRAFGAYNNGSGFPVVDVTGRPMGRTWSLIAETVFANAFSIKLLHDPISMGWRVGDRIAIAPMTALSEGNAESFTIASITTGNTVILSTPTQQQFSASFQQTGNDAMALQAAEVINLTRNIIFTGDDFTHIPCDPSLSDPFSMYGCSCNSGINRFHCTVGMHTIMAGPGLMKIQFVRTEKCGQRGIKGKYCLHFHEIGSCPECVFRGNAIEFGQQRGIDIHETHLANIVENVVYDIRGAGIFIEDGNEMYNKITYNVVICPWSLGGIQQGCTVPGTDNDQSDTSINQCSLWSLTPLNDVIGNRFANSFNGMFYDTGDFSSGEGGAYGHVNTYVTPVGRLIGNTFHGHGRFGTYILNYFPKKNCRSNVSGNGFLFPGATKCTPFTPSGGDNGYSVTISSNLDYDNAFVGGYDVGDLQYQSPTALNNLNNIYWKETKNFNDGCSAHITNGYYEGGNIALPDMAAFIIENTSFVNSHFEFTHHCNVGVTGVLCQPTYILSNVNWKQSFNWQWTEFHVEANNYGGMMILAPTEEANLHGSGGFFPPGYCALTSGTWTYLLNMTSNICVSTKDLNNAWPNVTAAQLSNIFSGGIICKKPVRSLKIYSRGLTLETAFKLRLQIYQGEMLLTTFSVPYHQIGADYANKQGYAFPVIIGTTFQYVLSLEGPDPNVPSDWIVEFSDAVFGNRWKADQIILTVQGTGCNRKLVSSQHDRSFIWADSAGNYLLAQAWGRGACNNTVPDTPAKICPTHVQAISTDLCSKSCTDPCENGYCDCGLQKCMCNPGYLGPACSTHVCNGVYCEHGKCIATFLGGILPVTQAACVCDKGWYGAMCDQNPCAGITCSNQGTCVNVGDTDWRCECNPNYSGRICQNTCIGFGCGSNQYPFGGCASWGPTIQTRYCLQGGGCSYTDQQPWLQQYGSNLCCYQNCDICNKVICPTATDDCHLGGSCQPNGSCSVETKRVDGTRCNSIPNGRCLNGACTATTILLPAPSFSPMNKSVPVTVPTLLQHFQTFTPSIKPMTLSPQLTVPTPGVSKLPGLCPDMKTSCFGCQLCPDLSMCTVGCAPSLGTDPTMRPTSRPSIAPALSTSLPSPRPLAAPTIQPTSIPTISLEHSTSPPPYKPTNLPTVKPMSSRTISPVQSTYPPSAKPTNAPANLHAQIPTTSVAQGLCPDKKTSCYGCQLCPDLSVCNVGCTHSPTTLVPSFTLIGKPWSSHLPTLIPVQIPWTESPSKIPICMPNLNYPTHPTFMFPFNGTNFPPGYIASTMIPTLIPDKKSISVNLSVSDMISHNMIYVVTIGVTMIFLISAGLVWLHYSKLTQKEDYDRFIKNDNRYADIYENKNMIVQSTKVMGSNPYHFSASSRGSMNDSLTDESNNSPSSKLKRDSFFNRRSFAMPNPLSFTGFASSASAGLSHSNKSFVSVSIKDFPQADTDYQDANSPKSLTKLAVSTSMRGLPSTLSSRGSFRGLVTGGINTNSGGINSRGFTPRVDRDRVNQRSSDGYNNDTPRASIDSCGNSEGLEDEEFAEMFGTMDSALAWHMGPRPSPPPKTQIHNHTTAVSATSSLGQADGASRREGADRLASHRRRIAEVFLNSKKDA